MQMLKVFAEAGCGGLKGGGQEGERAPYANTEAICLF